MRQSQRQAIKVFSFIIVSTAISSAAFSAETAAPKFAPVSGPGAGLMTSSRSPAAGMSMAAKYMPSDSWDQTDAHPIISLRKNQSDAQFSLGLGNDLGTIKGDNYSATTDQSYTHFTGGATIVSAMGIRFGARFEIDDDPYKTKVKKPVISSRKTKVEGQDLSFFAAAGLTQNFGVSLNMTMADHKAADLQESATLMAPAAHGDAGQYRGHLRYRAV